MEEEIALECKSLSKRFGKVTAVNSVSFTVKKREQFGFIGPNGAGKSSLVKMLTTLLPPTAGEAYINGINLTKHPAEVRKIIGYVPQLISADGNLTGYENLLLFAKLYGIPSNMREQRIRSALETMGLSAVADRFVREYSGGMIRRLEIVEALLHKPKILFLDEPTSGLDPVARKALWEHLIQIHKKEDLTMILTTHDMEEAEQICERVAIMAQGEIIAIGAITELKASVGKEASLNDVFLHYTGGSLEMENAYYAARKQRETEHKRG